MYTKTLIIETSNDNKDRQQVEELLLSFGQIPFRILAHSNNDPGSQNTEDPANRNPAPNVLEALNQGEADLAVYPARALPYPIPGNLEVIALLDPVMQKPKIPILSPNKSEYRLIPNSLYPHSVSPHTPDKHFKKTVRSHQMKALTDDAIPSVHTTFSEKASLKTISELLAVITKKSSNRLQTLFKKRDIRRTFGKVTLAGFGPGDPELLTVRALQRLRTADIIFYDDLLNRDYLDHFSGQKVYVGKRKDKHHREQDEINRMLYEAALDGKQVVRLKGGDPMLFAHGGEELEFLHRHFIKTEVIPGITTALAAAAEARIPLTHRKIASSVTFLTGHNENDLNIPASGTLVYYMGASNLSSIVHKALAAGWPPETPVLLISDVSLPSCQEVYTTLLEASSDIFNLKTPLIIIIGAVVGLKHHSSHKLENPKILFTGTHAGKLKRYGKVIYIPYVEPVTTCQEVLRQTLDRIRTYAWILFTNPQSVTFFFKGLRKLNCDARILAGIRIASLSNDTSSELNSFGIIPDYESDDSNTGLSYYLKPNPGTSQEILLVQSTHDSQNLKEALQTTHNRVTALPVYTDSFIPKNTGIFPGAYDYIAFNTAHELEVFFRIHDPAQFTHQKFIITNPEALKKYELLGLPETNVKASCDPAFPVIAI